MFVYGTNEGIHMRLSKCIGSYALPLCQYFLLSQVSIALMGYKPLVDICDAWLYVQFVDPWHGDELVIANANPHAMRMLLPLGFCKAWIRGRILFKKGRMM